MLIKEASKNILNKFKLTLNDRMKNLKTSSHILLNFLILIILQFTTCALYGEKLKPIVVVYPAPKEEKLNTFYQVKISNQTLPVYNAKVNPQDQEKRLKAFNNVKLAADYFDIAAFAYFDMQGVNTITVIIPNNITTAKVLPASAGIKPIIKGHTIIFNIAKPQNLTVEINGEYVKSLHIFANPIETNKPKPNDPNVIYYGPGIHEVNFLKVGDNKTVYIAGGGIVRAVIDPHEAFKISSEGLKKYENEYTFILAGKNITFRGRGILDGSNCSTHSKNLVLLRGSNIKIEGIILRDPSIWTIPISQSDTVSISNIKILGYRPNSDGIDIVSSTNVVVKNCFIRTNDDLVVIKTNNGQGSAKNITVSGCVLWNQLAHALSIGAEISDPVDNIHFTNCDVIHDKGIEWTLRVYQTDSALVNHVYFENIRIEEAHKLISLWIGKANWSRDKDFGHIKNITFKHIKAIGKPLNIELTGVDSQHQVQNITFEDIKLNGKQINTNTIKSNTYVNNVVINP